MFIIDDFMYGGQTPVIGERRADFLVSVPQV